MIPFSESTMHLATLLASVFVASLWQGCLVVACVALCMRLLPGLSATLRSFLWTLTFLVLALVPLVSISTSSHAPQALPQPSTLMHLDARWALGLFAAWLLLAGWRLLRLLRGAIELRRVAVSATPVEAPEAVADLLVARLPFRASRVLLCTSDHVDVPSVAGFFRPRILLPAGLLYDLPASDLRQIVLHELEHLRRFDDWSNLLQKTGIALHPLNPVLFWIDRRVCLERELACDDGVLRVTGATKAYATCLVNLAERTILRRSLALALGAWRRRSELARRVHRILLPAQAHSRVPANVVGYVASSILVLSSVCLLRTPSLVAFDGSGPTTASLISPAPLPTAHDAQPNVNVQLTLAHPATAHPALMRVSAPRRTAVVAPHVRAARRLAVKQLPPRTSLRQVNSSGAEPRLVLLNWHPADLAAARFALALAQDSNFTYAAVPVRNGWLFVQL